MGDETLILFPSLSLLRPQPSSGESPKQGKLRDIQGLASYITFALYSCAAKAVCSEFVLSP